MNVSVFGLGYVGVVTAACLAEDGHTVIGVDVSATKIDQVNRGESPIVEDSIGEMIARNVRAGRLRATNDCEDAILAADIILVCVGTPSRADGSLDLSHVEQVASQIASVVSRRSAPIVLVFRSTMLPGSIARHVIPVIQSALGDSWAEKCTVVYHPEFLREGSSVEDFYAPPKIVVGERTAGDGSTLLSLYGEKYRAPRVCCEWHTAEMVKYCDNIFHALKITFANEIGQFCAAHRVDSRAVMDIFVQDVVLNISSRYLRPGFAFGGSCLPKDMRALLSAARSRSLELPMLTGVLRSNLEQIERVLVQIADLGVRSVGVHGLAFKPGTDDLRESPYVEVAERLLGKGIRLTIYDPNVVMSRLIGRNRAYIEQKLPHLAAIVTDEIGALDRCELVLVAHPVSSDRIADWMAKGCRVMDLSGQHRARPDSGLITIV